MILALLLAPSLAVAQSACLPHGKMVDLLAGRYSEQRVSAGLEWQDVEPKGNGT